ncbi:MAG: hypothetical protein H6502_04480 [Candidatus Woesearchaeota archaeon]|nr:MAG: hypothetical protein H6502_04480 [Candidatus Woesearchaeota archaeon]
MTHDECCGGHCGCHEKKELTMDELKAYEKALLDELDHVRKAIKASKA